MSAGAAPAPCRATLDAATGPTLGVAVSGGSDSTALLLLLQDWARDTGRTLLAVTLDHGLRPESGAEAAAVSGLCGKRSIAHTTLRWQEAPGSGNLQHRARDARRALIAAWAQDNAIAAVALGHTLDDQAETFLMRLARGSGVDGLAAMHPVTAVEGVTWLRPLLGLRRADLRDWLRHQGVAWSEDPGNRDARFERIRMRNALGTLADLGLPPVRLAATAAAMARARDALQAAAAQTARACLSPRATGEAVLDPGNLADVPEEIRLRVLAGALGWVSGARYRPRLSRLEALMAAIEAGSLGCGATLHGCVLRPGRGRVVIRREPSRVAPPVPVTARSWDGRWQIRAPRGEDLTLGALGAEGLAACPGWRDSGASREALLTTPALWRDGELVEAPFAGRGSPAAFRRISRGFDPWGAAILR